MSLHIETHMVKSKRGQKDKQQLVLVTDTGIVLATFKSAAMVKLYIEQVALSWMFAHEAGRSGI